MIPYDYIILKPYDLNRKEQIKIQVIIICKSFSWLYLSNLICAILKMHI